MPETRIILGSRNAKKAAEIREMFAPLGIPLVGLGEFPEAGEVVEDGETFADNARKKASETALAIGEWTLAEDSGICVDALGGAPGVYSARYSGEPCDDLRNNRKLIEELAGVAAEKRRARYVCHIALATPVGEIVREQEAECGGRIVDEPRGTNGFGYDPHFLIPEYHRTFGELSPLVKKTLSHRGRAFVRFLAGFERFWQNRALSRQ